MSAYIHKPISKALAYKQHVSFIHCGSGLESTYTSRELINRLIACLIAIIGNIHKRLTAKIQHFDYIYSFVVRGSDFLKFDRILYPNS